MLAFLVNVIIAYLTGSTAYTLWEIKWSGAAEEGGLLIGQMAFFWGAFELTTDNLVFWACVATLICLTCLISVIKSVWQWLHPPLTAQARYTPGFAPGTAVDNDAWDPTIND